MQLVHGATVADTSIDALARGRTHRDGAAREDQSPARQRLFDKPCAQLCWRFPSPGRLRRGTPGAATEQ